MILFPFATQATEPAPGASIEEPRLLLDGFFTDRKHKQTQANTGSTQTEHTHRHPRAKRQSESQRAQTGQKPEAAGERNKSRQSTEDRETQRQPGQQTTTSHREHRSGDSPLPQHLSDQSVGPSPGHHPAPQPPRA